MNGSQVPSEEELASGMRADGLHPHSWDGGPGEVYGRHQHSYQKILYCARGAITFHTDDGDMPLAPGDRMVLPPYTPHSATVGPSGVRCVEAGMGKGGQQV